MSDYTAGASEGAGAAPPPPSYSQSTNTAASYVDFCPVCLKKGGWASMPKFERFDVLLGRANAWLVANPGWKVMNCETVESKLDWGTAREGMTADTVTSSYYEAGKAATAYNKSLRLWICNKTPADNPAPQQVGYLNVVPACISQGGFLSQPKFENFAETMQKFNAMIAQQPIQGRIINMETQNMKFETWSGSVDPEVCVWIESGQAATFFLNIFRIFYEPGMGVVTSIGTADFVPAQLTPDKVFSLGTFEPFGAVVAKANTWFAQQPASLNICNVQSIDYKVSKGWGGTSLDTMRSLYYEPGKAATVYLRILRAYWIQGTDSTNPPPRQTPLQISYRTFMPAQLTTGGFMSLAGYESQVESMKRALAWCNATGAKVISAETVEVRTHGQQNMNSEVTYAYNVGTMIYVIGLRLYFDGHYNDPPPEALPPVPQMQQSNSDCCVIL